ncbi:MULTISPECIES: ABC transporter permease [Lactobacillus]|jgi:putative ABC transport system permease protein|uniref:ABC transporter permease n=1 Tax=Lactobacillus porci TaxID=2012477 RepID=A0A6A8MDU0_9LACO|nr:ABC transporter permease [Lactobacillus porci]MST86953.1 ABC transporter permease [Lactobacillus porci]
MGAYFASLNFLDFLGRLPAAAAQGLFWGIMALGVYITFRILDIADLTVDGTFATGGAISAVLILKGWTPWATVGAALVLGLLAGAVTGLLHTKLGIPAILAGILTQYALYSINLAIMSFKANTAISSTTRNMVMSGLDVNGSLLVCGVIVIVLIALMYWFFGTEIGEAIRATGTNQEMSKAQGINIDRMKVLGLALSNGLVAVAGSLSSQYSGFADVNAGRGSIVIGLAAVIIGEVVGNAILGKKLNFAGHLAFVVVGAILYYVVYTLILWLKMNPNLMKLFTAIIVALFLAVPYLRSRAKSSFAKAGKNSKKMEAK